METLNAMPRELVSEACRLLTEAADNFPNLETEGFRVNLERNIRRGTTFYVSDGGTLAGFIIYSRLLSQISFLLVAPSFRGRGYGEALLRAAVEALGADGIQVVTYREGNPLGTAARALYHKLGFKDAELIDGFEIPVQKMTLKRADYRYAESFLSGI